MLNSMFRFSERRAVRSPCLNGGICVTICFFTISILSCFFLLLFFAGIGWALIYLCAAAFLSSLYIYWLRRSRQISDMIPVSAFFLAVEADTGLDASAIAVLPSFQYQRFSKDSNNGIDGNGWVQCAICIGNVQIGEMVRNLPACKHLFHVECVDMWLSSHSTCPMCRTKVMLSDIEVQPPV